MLLIPTKFTNCRTELYIWTKCQEYQLYFPYLLWKSFFVRPCSSPPGASKLWQLRPVSLWLWKLNIVLSSPVLSVVPVIITA